MFTRRAFWISKGDGSERAQNHEKTNA